MEVYDGSSRRIDLVERPAGASEGGQAKVWDVRGRQSLVAKIYKDPADFDRDRIGYMLRHPPDVHSGVPGVPTLAWPLEILYDSGRRAVGFFMPKVRGAATAALWISPHLRSRHFPKADYSAVYCIARNVSAAFATAHARSYVVGDVNEENVMVHPNYCVTIIDVDSFQVVDRSGTVPRVFRCPVDRPGFRSPERLAHGKALSKYVRTPHDDLFALGVLIYKLIREGSHPFDGVPAPSATTYPSLDDRVRMGWFPPLKNSPIWPGPTRLPFETMHRELQAMMLRCFVEGTKAPERRPSAMEWVETFDGFF